MPYQATLTSSVLRLLRCLHDEFPGPRGRDHDVGVPAPVLRCLVRKPGIQGRMAVGGEELVRGAPLIRHVLADRRPGRVRILRDKGPGHARRAPGHLVGPHPGQLLPVLARERAAGQQPVADAGGSQRRGRRSAADPDRDRLLDRLGRDLDAVIRKKTPREVHRAWSPRLPEDRDDLLQPLTPRPGGDAQAGVFLVPVAEADAENQPAAAEHIGGRRVLGQPHGVVEGGEQDAGADAHAAGPGGDGRAEHQDGGRVAVLDEMMLCRPDDRRS